MAQIIVYPNRQASFDALVGTGLIYDDATLHIGLIKSIPSLSTRLTKADMDAVVATFGGYAAKTTLTAGSQYRDANDNVFKDWGELEWIATSDVADAQVAGAYWHDGTNLLLFETFDLPVDMSETGLACRYIPVFAYGQ